MTPTDEARFLELWNAGLETAEIARQLGINATTAQSRAHRLQQRGLIAPRPRGGAYPSLRSQARQDGAPATPPAPTRDTPAITMVAVPELREIINRFSALEARVAALKEARDPPAPAIDAGGTRALVSIYALQDPETQEVRYIGQTVSPDLRFRVHVRGRGESAAKTAWIRSLLQRGKEPELVILEGDVPADVGATREAYWLDHYRNLGADLLNFNTAQPHPQAPPAGPTRAHPHPWNYQAVDPATLATPHRRGEGRGRDRGQRAESSRRGVPLESAHRSPIIADLTEPENGGST